MWQDCCSPYKKIALGLDVAESMIITKCTFHDYYWIICLFLHKMLCCGSP